MKTRNIILQFDWLNVVGNSSQFESMADLIREKIDLKQSIKETYVRRNKRLLRQLTPRQFPYFREAARKIMNFYVKQWWRMKFDDEALLKKVKQVAGKPLKA